MPDDKAIEEIKSIKDIKSIFMNIFPIFFRKNNNIGVLSMCVYRIEKKDKKKIFDKYIKLNDDYYPAKMLFKKGLFGFNIGKYSYYLNFYRGVIPMEPLVNYPPQSLFKMSFKHNNEESVMPVIYNLIHLTKYKGKTSKVCKIDDDFVCYFRQAKMNSIGVTVRKPNVTDSFKERCKIFWAKLLSMVTPKSKIILLYEKEANKYEESASEVYEKLIDQGYNNAHFVLKKDSKHVEFIKDKYKDNIIWAYTFKHYYNWFKCNTFIGSETTPHSMELRAANQYITKKFIKKKYKQVFLQHGVMYMVALNPKKSGFLKNGNEMPADAKIVVSSKLEADHFVELGNYDYEDLYITGLPFYDRTIKKPAADKIVVMLTWRPWDYNLLLSDYKKASYYKINKKIIDSIPKKYHDKVILLPHPLILDKFKDIDLNKWIPDIKSYDKILEDTALLITDYSSIAYSAFYRGANVIFCWDELEECMEQYGSHLMLNDDNTFGDITRDSKNISKLIEKNYLKPQDKKYKEKYKKIVEFDDNKNTERLIEFLKRDKII